MAQQQIADLSAQNQELTQEVANRTGYADYLYNTINGGQRT